jgi:hypothetical protein
MLTADYVFWAAVAFMAGTNLYYSTRIKNHRVAMQWRLNGKPTWYAPKTVALWGTVAFALAVRLLIWAAMTYLRDKVHGAEVGLLLFSIIMAAVHFFTLRAAVQTAN